MTRHTLASSIAVLALVGCKDKAREAKPEPTGSAGSSSAAPPVDAKPPSKFTTPDAKLQRYNECWKAFDAGNNDAFRGCFASDAVREQVDNIPELVAQGSEKIVEMAKAQRGAFPDLVVTPQLVVVSGNDIAAILHVAGSNTGEAGGMKATGKKLGVFEAELAVMNDDGVLTKDSFYIDQPTMFHQLGLLKNDTSPGPLKPRAAPQTLIAKGDPSEAANKAVVEKLVEAINKKDAKAIEALAADDVKLTYHGDKQEVVGKKAFVKWWKDTIQSTKDGFVDIKGSWAAGDYVVISDVFTGTPTQEAVGKGGEIKKFEARVVQFFQVTNGKIAREEIFMNRLSTAVQLGMVDPDQLMQTLSKAGGK